MTTDYDPIAEQYKRSKLQPWRAHIEAYTLVGLLGDLAESAVALIEKETGAAELRDEHVRPAVVVDVADGHAHAVAGNIQSGTGTDVGEAAIGALMKESVGRARVGTPVL